MKNIEAIFLDTNVFEAANFEFSDNSLEKLIAFSHKYSLPIYIDEMVYGEVLKRIEHKTNEWVEGLKNEKLTIISRTFPYIPANKDAIRSGMFERLNTLFMSKTSDGTILTIPSDYDPSELIYLYHAGLPPFNVDNKKNEFPDAIAMMNARNFATRNSKNILVISGDNGVKEFCIANGLDHSEMPSHALHVLNSQYNLNKFYLQYQDKINAEIEQYILSNNIHFEFYGMTFNYDDVEADYSIEYVTINSLNLLAEDDACLTMSVAANVSITFIVNTDQFPDYDYAIRDKEDDIWFTYMTTKIQFQTEETIEILFDIEIGDFHDGSIMLTHLSAETLFEFDPNNIHGNILEQLHYPVE